MRRRLLLDNDIFLLLSGAGLMGVTLEGFGFAWEEARRLDALFHMLRRRSNHGACWR